MSRTLVSFDTDHIKDYVFATDRLREISGASDLLDMLNRREMPGIVGGETIFASGGGGLFVVDQSDAGAAIERVQRLYAERTAGAASITGVTLDLPDDFDIEQDAIGPLWHHLGLKLAAEKATLPPFHASVSHPLLIPGDSDGDHYAVKAQRDEDGRERLLSRVSLYKQEQRRSGHISDFDEIAAGSRPPGSFALIYADGDDFGRALADSPTLRTLGKTAEHLYTLMKDTRRSATRTITSPYEVLLSGGDDLVLAVPSDAALDVALALSRGIASASKQAVGRQLSMTVAIVWAHESFPFSSWVELASGAVSFAKRAAAEQKTAGLINFLAVSSANQIAFRSFYKSYLSVRDGETRRIVRTLRPYTADQLEALLRYRRGESRSLPPRSRLEGLRAAVFQEPVQRAQLDCMHALVHWRGDKSRKALDDLIRSYAQPTEHVEFPFLVSTSTDASGGPVTSYRTPIADLAEIWDYCGDSANAN